MRSQLACVLEADSGIFQILSSRGVERATMSGGLLAAVAADESSRPACGDWVEWRSWPDGRVTISRLASPRSLKSHLRLVS